MSSQVVMSNYTHQTAPTQFVEANGIRFAYRRFGKTGGVPIVFNQHYIGTMDYWDPTVTDGLARDRPYKGDCNYYSVPAGGEKCVNAVWSYENPFPAVAQIRGHVAFYPERVDEIAEQL